MKSNNIIADSSGLFSLFIETDKNNSKAKDIVKIILKESKTIIIPEDIFSELINILGKKFNHKKAAAIAYSILEANVFLIESTSEDARTITLRKFEKQPKSVSFTDCLVMAAADEFETKEIFGFDDAFLKNGYRRIGIDKK